MIYLKSFQLLSEEKESDFFLYEEKRTCFNNLYPFKLFPDKQLENIEFDSINIFYGGNGSGKSTILNIIAEKLNAQRKQEFNKGHFFDKYVEKCHYELGLEKPETIKIVTSDDVFDYLFDIRSINSNVEKKRNELFEEYLNSKYNGSSDFSDYENLKKTVASRKKTMSSYVRERLIKNNIIEQSNGESALMYFENEIKENAIYILDEPENSLSAESQLKLVKYIEESARFFNCQFIISTHSPFLLSMRGAKIFDLDSVPVITKKWTELENVLVYYNFFKEHENEF